MKILLDENLPHALRRLLLPEQVFTVAYMRWSGIKNGNLLELCASSGFDVLITSDRGLAYEQNIDQLPVAVLILLGKSNDEADLAPMVPQIVAALKNLKPRTLARIEIGN